MTSDERTATAHHEAGHAVVAHLLGLPVTAASVIRRPGTLGRVHLAQEAHRAVRDDEHEDAIAGWAKASLAGPLAQAFYVLGRRWRRFSPFDWRELGGEVDVEHAMLLAEVVAGDGDGSVRLLVCGGPRPRP